MERDYAKESVSELRMITGLLTALVLVGVVACFLLWKIYGALT